MRGKPVQISGVPVWLKNHSIFETYPLSGYRANTV